MKTAWALGAAFVAVVLMLIVFGVLATQMGSAERLSSTETFDGIDLPRIGTVGDFPDPAHRVVVNVTADGTIVVEGTTRTFEELRAELKRRGAMTPGDAIPGTTKRLSDASVVLRVDGSLPWGATQALEQTCADAMIWRVFFAVSHESEGGEGAVAAFLSKDAGSEGFADPSNDQRRVCVTAVAGYGTPDALFAALRALPKAGTLKLLIDLDADPSITTRAAVSLSDAAIRAGAASIEFAMPAPRREGAAPIHFETLVRGRGELRPPFSVWIGDENWNGNAGAPRQEVAPAMPPPSMPSAARVRGAIVGVTEPKSLVHHD